MKKHPTNHTSAKHFADVLCFNHYGEHYEIPRKIAEKYRKSHSPSTQKTRILAEEVFTKLNQTFTKAGALLKGIRSRENMTQLEFAKKIQVSQGDLSKMERGQRPIGKMIAKRVAKLFDINYRLLLE